MRAAAALFLAVAAAGASAHAEGTFTVRLITPEAALKAAQAALAKCREAGFQVSVSVVDRSGVPQVLLRDRLAAPQTADTAQRKARTAANFRMDTLALDREMQPGRPAAGLRALPEMLAVGGGRPIEAARVLVGALGVSGAPGAANDDMCAAAGIAAIAEDLEL
jgi:uncharacterized protein GlcG (DUF336 family)